MVYKSTGTISWFILSLENRINWMKRLDLYNKSRVMGDYQARFCEIVPREASAKCFATT